MSINTENAMNVPVAISVEFENARASIVDAHWDCIVLARFCCAHIFYSAEPKRQISAWFWMKADHRSVVTSVGDYCVGKAGAYLLLLLLLPRVLECRCRYRCSESESENVRREGLHHWESELIMSY